MTCGAVSKPTTRHGSCETRAVATRAGSSATRSGTSRRLVGVCVIRTLEAAFDSARIVYNFPILSLILSPMIICMAEPRPEQCPVTRDTSRVISRSRDTTRHGTVAQTLQRRATTDVDRATDGRERATNATRGMPRPPIPHWSRPHVRWHRLPSQPRSCGVAPP